MDKIPLTNNTSVQVSIGSDVTVLTQTRVNVTCDVSGVPKPKVSWLKDGEQVGSEEDSSLVLTIRNVEDAGQVTCQAENLAGKATRSTNIDVIGKKGQIATEVIGLLRPFDNLVKAFFVSSIQFTDKIGKELQGVSSYSLM